MNKNAIGLHKFSRIFRRGILQYFPHIPCRLQHERRILCRFRLFFASTRPVQIATYCPSKPCWDRESSLPPHAPCRLQHDDNAYLCTPHGLCLHTLRADCNHACTLRLRNRGLCLHTLRADCNADATPAPPAQAALPPHAPCRLQRAAQSAASIGSSPLPPHAPCRLQHRPDGNASRRSRLCLHTLRADCNCTSAATPPRTPPLPPHAPCRLQREAVPGSRKVTLLCLHTLRADCNGRNAQNAICTFQNVC